MSLLIEIFEENQCVDEFTASSGRIMRSQVAYAHLDGKFPQRMKLPLSDGQNYYSSGQYQLTLDSYRIGKYDSLEINNFDMKLMPISTKLSKVS